MGNCIMKPSRRRQLEEDKYMEQLQEERELAIKKDEFVKESGNNEIKKIKIVLTKEELEWLMFQLKNNKGKKLEDILGEIERGRAGKVYQASCWKPSLESITESPEGLEMER